MGTLDGKVALITGAARGTGSVTAAHFVREGARVMIADILDEAGREFAGKLGESAQFVHLDVTDPSSWTNAVEVTCAKWGGLDVLVNNAGVLLLKSIADTDAAEYDRVVAVNQKGAFLGIKAVIEPMKAAGRGSIVNISSIDGKSAKNGLAAYASSKWAVRGLTRVAALELGKFGIRVNAVCPEAGSAEMMAPYIPEGIDVEMIAAHSQPLLSTQRERRIADRLQDIAQLIAFLASDASASCTGADFLIDGGNLAGSVIPGTPGS